MLNCCSITTSFSLILNMKLQELYDYDGKSASKINQSKMFGRNITKVKTLLLFVGYVSVCIGFYCVGRNNVNHKMAKVYHIKSFGLECHQQYYEHRFNSIERLEDQVNAMHNLLNDIKINSHVGKREVEKQSHVNKRNAVDGDEEFEDRTSSTGRRGATYIRWGSRNCDGPENTKLVYEGEAAGSEYDKTGGGSTVICIDHNISYTPGRYVNGNQGAAYIYGIEYAITSPLLTLFDLSRTEGGNPTNFNIPCALCMATGVVNQVMIPGRETCPPHWKKEYTGYIMSGYHTHKHSKPYLCIDDTPQVVPGSDTGHSDGLLYPVETQCPSLQCEPFVHGRELRCVVCTI